jgi:hypothetical protein
VTQQQGASFVAGKAKKGLSQRHGFGIMRVASQKEFMGKYQESGRQQDPRGSQQIFQAITTASLQQRRF